MVNRGDTMMCQKCHQISGWLFLIFGVLFLGCFRHSGLDSLVPHRRHGICRHEQVQRLHVHDAKKEVI